MSPALLGGVLLLSAQPPPAGWRPEVVIVAGVGVVAVAGAAAPTAEADVGGRAGTGVSGRSPAEEAPPSGQPQVEVAAAPTAEADVGAWAGAGVSARSPSEEASQTIGASAGREHGWPVEPVVGLAFGLLPQALELSGSEAATSLRSPSGVTTVTAGVRYEAWSGRLWLHSGLRAGLGSLDSHWQLGLQQQALLRVELTEWLGLRGGLGVAATLDVTAPAFSAADASLLLGVQLWRFELLWTPGLQVPLGSTSRGAGGAVRVSQGMALAFVPVAFSLRFAFGPRG